MRVHLSSLSQNKRSSKYHFDINNDVLKQSHTCRQKELLNLLQKEVRFSTSTTDTSISTSFLPSPSLKGYLNFQTSFLCPHTVMTDHMFICSLSQMQQGIRYIRRSLSLPGVNIQLLAQYLLSSVCSRYVCTVLFCLKRKTVQSLERWERVFGMRFLLQDLPYFRLDSGRKQMFLTDFRKVTERKKSYSVTIQKFMHFRVTFRLFLEELLSVRGIKQHLTFFFLYSRQLCNAQDLVVT